jgi:hypothetical protein
MKNRLAAGGWRLAAGGSFLLVKVPPNTSPGPCLSPRPTGFYFLCLRQAPAVAHRDQVRRDGHGDLRGGAPADRQPDRTAQAGDGLRRQAELGEALAASDLAAA